MKRLTVLPFLLIAFVSGFSPGYAQQVDPRPLLAALIWQLQNGRPDPNLIGHQLWIAIAQQTNNTGFNPLLAQLGPVSSIQVTQEAQLPQGPIWAMSARHQNGYSNWQLGFMLMTGKIEYALLTDLGPGRPTEVEEIINEDDDKEEQVETACEKFPQLCKKK